MRPTLGSNAFSCKLLCLRKLFARVVAFPSPYATIVAGYQVVTDGHLGSVGGTSASTPAFAGMISLINEALLQKGGKQLGFLNPFLYHNEDEGFTDVTIGVCPQWPWDKFCTSVVYAQDLAVGG